MIHLAPYLMERQLDPTAGKLLQNELEKQGMKFLLEKQTAEIVGDERVEGLSLKTDVLEADLVVMAVGIKPNVQLAKEAGLNVNRGIVVNDYMQTDIPNIYAVGECAEHRGMVYGLVAPLYEQGKALAKAICGAEKVPYEGSVLSTQLKVSGVEVFSAGDFTEDEEKKRSKCSMNKTAFIKACFARQSNRRSRSFGDSSDGNRLFSMIQKQEDVSDVAKVSILQPSGGNAGESLVASMSADDIICGCNGVTKGTIVEAIQKQGCSSVDEIKACTSASRSCGDVNRL